MLKVIKTSMGNKFLDEFAEESKVLEPRISKICIIGDGGVGKTSICRRIAENTFTEKYNATIEADFFVTQLISKMQEISLNLFDLSGHAEFFEQRKPLYENCEYLIIVYDTSVRKTFEEIDRWKREAMKFSCFPKVDSKEEKEEGKIIVLGNKIDLV